MNALEAQLDYCLGTAVPEPGRAVDVAPGVRWVRMQLPFALNHINLWLLRDRLAGEGGGPAREGWTIVDCGIDNAATRAAWEEVFATGLDGLPVLRVIVTHMHPDHIGSANWLCERWNARLWISATDFGIARMASSASAGFGGPLSAAFMAVHGMAADPKAVDALVHDFLEEIERHDALLAVHLVTGTEDALRVAEIRAFDLDDVRPARRAVASRAQQ